jgi:hypothetical protein
MTTNDPLPAASPEHLTAGLRECGVLGEALIGDVTMAGSFPKLRSHTRRLRLDYDGSAGDAPASLILKMGHLDGAGRPAYANRNEIAFYRDIALALPMGLVPGLDQA